MYYRLPYKTKQFFFVLIKLSIVAGASYFVYNRLVNNGELDFRVFVDFLTKNDVFSSKNIFFVLFLTVFNWFLEILKWQKLVHFIKKISFFEALQQSLSALTASLFTPNRIGEYGAKAVYFSKRFRKRVLILNLIGNSFQMAVTVILGLVGLYFFITTYNVEISYYRVSRFGILILFATVFAVFGVRQKRFKIKGFSIERLVAFLKDIPLKVKASTFLLSLMRYAVFSFQFFFLLKILGANQPYETLIIGITAMYLLSSIIPTIFIFDVLVKGSVAVFVFGYFGINELVVLCVITLMWLLNFVLPSIFGSFYVLNFNYSTAED